MVARYRNPPEMVYVVACAWCDKVLEVRPTKDARMAGRVSHGICAPCRRKAIRDALAASPPPASKRRRAASRRRRR
jgi:hypothetical protein